LITYCLRQGFALFYTLVKGRVYVQGDLELAITIIIFILIFRLQDLVKLSCPNSGGDIFLIFAFFLELQGLLDYGAVVGLLELFYFVVKLLKD
jgi:hypothetical protein